MQYGNIWLPSQTSQYFRGGGSTRFFVPSAFNSPLVGFEFPVALCIGLGSED